MNSTVIAFYLGVVLTLIAGLGVLAYGWQQVRRITSDWIRAIGTMQMASLSCNYALVIWLGIAFGLPTIAPLIVANPVYGVVMVAVFFGIMAATTAGSLYGLRMLTQPPEQVFKLWRVLPLAVAPFGATALVVMILAMMSAPPPPFAFSQAVYEPRYEVICVGGTLEFPLGFTVTTSDVVAVEFVDGYQRVDGVQGVAGDPDGASVWVYGGDADLHYPAVERQLPDGVTVGEWEYLGYATTDGYAPVSYRVPFAAVECE